MNKEIGKHCLSMLLPVLFLSCSANTGGMFGEATGELNFTEAAFASGAFRLGPAINSMAAMTAKDKAKLLYEEGLYSEGIFSPNIKAEDPAQKALEFILERPSGDDLNYFFLGWIAESKGYLDAAYEYYKEGYVNIKGSLAMAAAFMASSLITSRMVKKIKEETIKKLVAIFLIIIGIGIYVT